MAQRQERLCNNARAKSDTRARSAVATPADPNRSATSKIALCSASIEECNDEQREGVGLLVILHHLQARNFDAEHFPVWIRHRCPPRASAGAGLALSVNEGIRPDRPASSRRHCRHTACSISAPLRAPGSLSVTVSSSPPRSPSGQCGPECVTAGVDPVLW